MCVSHQKALGAVGAEREGDGGSVFVRQANERRSILRHVRQAAEPTVLHAAAGHCSTTGERQVDETKASFWHPVILISIHLHPTALKYV